MRQGLPNIREQRQGSRLLRSLVTPSRWGSWFKPMIKAAALVKPLMTGRERKLTKNPSLNMPMPNCKAPIMKASNKASAM